MNPILLALPRDYSFELVLSFLQRSPHELLHRLDRDRVVKLVRFGVDPVLFEIRLHDPSSLAVKIVNGKPSKRITALVTNYVKEWLDLETDLEPFYRLAKKDDLLKPLIRKYYGYRIVGLPDLFESLVWAVLGQQINLSFAYKLKHRFVDHYGKSLEFQGQRYHAFPNPETVSSIDPDQLLKLQFSRQKASYSVGIAKAFMEGRISKEMLSGLPLNEAKEELMKIKGVGNWTANYALMKTFHYPDAFPLEDAGLHNAIKKQLGLKAKPSLDRVKKLFRKYKGWEAYATLYLWKSL